MRNIRNAKSGKINLGSLKAAIRDCKKDATRLAELEASITDREDPERYFREFVAPRYDAFGDPLERVPAIDTLRHLRDCLTNDIAAMPEHKRGSRWHLDRHAELTRINGQIRRLNDAE